MKNSFKRLLSLTLVMVMLLSFAAFADDKDKGVDKEKIGQELKSLELLKGDDKGNLNTDGALKREHALVVLTRLMGQEDEAQKFDGKVKFTDIEYDYYKPFAAYAVEKGWLTGRSETEFGFGDEISADEFYALVLRALGHTEYKGEKFKEVAGKAIEIGLTKDASKTADEKLSRGDAFVVMKNALAADVKGAKNGENLFESLKLKEYTEKNENIVIMHTNDMHGFFLEGKYDGMGAAKVTRFVDLVKAENDDALYVDAGDAIQGYNLVTLSKGEAAIKIMNRMGVQMMTLGNHEFDYGQEQLKKLEKQAKFPFLGGNVLDKDNKALYKAYEIKEIKGKKVAFIGIDTPETLYKSHPDNTKGITFEKPVDFAKKTVAELKGKADIIVALVHLGDEVGKEDFSSIDLANKVPELDVIIDGHSHSTYKEGKMVNGVLLASAGEKTKNVGFIEINPADKTDKHAKLFDKSASKYIKENTDVLKVVNEIKDANEKILKEVVATSLFDLVGERAVVRKGESTLGNLLTAALKDVSKADFALTNGGGIRASIDVGDVTKGDILSAFPFGNTVRVIELTGKDVRAALEHGVSKYPEENGGFPHVAGLRFTFDSSKEAGSRIVEITVDGKGKIEDDKTYTLVTNDFLVAGGDAYSMLTGKKVVAEFGAMDEVLIAYVKEKGFDAAALDERVKDVSPDTATDN